MIQKPHILLRVVGWLSITSLVGLFGFIIVYGVEIFRRPLTPEEVENFEVIEGSAVLISLLFLLFGILLSVFVATFKRSHLGNRRSILLLLFPLLPALCWGLTVVGGRVFWGLNMNTHT